VRIEEKTIDRPSGDQEGLMSSAESRVRSFRLEPSASMV